MSATYSPDGKNNGNDSSSSKSDKDSYHLLSASVCRAHRGQCSQPYSLWEVGAHEYRVTGHTSSMSTVSRAEKQMRGQRPSRLLVGASCAQPCSVSGSHFSSPVKGEWDMTGVG